MVHPRNVLGFSRILKGMKSSGSKITLWAVVGTVVLFSVILYLFNSNSNIVANAAAIAQGISALVLVALTALNIDAMHRQIQKSQEQADAAQEQVKAANESIRVAQEQIRLTQETLDLEKDHHLHVAVNDHEGSILLVNLSRNTIYVEHVLFYPTEERGRIAALDWSTNNQKLMGGRALLAGESLMFNPIEEHAAVLGEGVEIEEGLELDDIFTFSYSYIYSMDPKHRYLVSYLLEAHVSGRYFVRSKKEDREEIERDHFLSAYHQ